VFIHEDRAHLELEAGQDVAAEAAADVDLRVRPKGDAAAENARVRRERRRG